MSKLDTLHRDIFQMVRGDYMELNKSWADSLILNLDYKRIFDQSVF